MSRCGVALASPVGRRPLLALLVLAFAASSPPPVPSEVLPWPAAFAAGAARLALAPSFTIACASDSPAGCPAPLGDAFARYAQILFFAGTPSPPPSSQPSLGRAVVSVARDAVLAPLNAVTDEAYNLSVQSDGSPAVISATTQWGALRALESLAQLVVWQGPDDAANAYVITCAPVEIADAPRFAIRGVLIDTSFNFLTVQRILDVVDSMAVMKANVLHWHCLDDPSWPMETSSFPAFTAPGSSGPYASVAVYSRSDQERIAHYAWARGVAVLLEFDVPGHSASWGASGSVPSLVVSCGDGHQTLINPVGEPGEAGTFYAALAQLVDEFGARIAAVGVPGGGPQLLPFVHLGGDEVSDYTCWLQSAAVQAWARSLNISGDARSVRAAFTDRVQRVVAAKKLRPMFWEEAFTGDFGVDLDAVVTPWVHTGTIKRAAASGRDVVAYVGFYLDQWRPPAQTGDPEWYLANVTYGYIESWRLFYTFEPLDHLSEAEAAHVLGGVASAWGDNVDSSVGATGLLFPRALAIAEKLWSPRSFTSVTDPGDDAALDPIAARLEHARCRLAQRGIGASPVGVAGTYGFCWSPAWALNASSNGGSDASDAIVLSSGSLAATLLGTAALSVLLALGCVFGSRVLVALERGSPSLSESPPPLVVKTAERFVALDQLRGLTILAMLFVNLNYSHENWLPPFFWHGITYTSGPDLVEPAFHFCVGFALRITLPRRLDAARRGGSAGWLAPRLVVFRQLLETRVLGLILISMFFTEGWADFSSMSWTDFRGFSDWLQQLVQSVAPYHTLLHIALLTLYCFPAMVSPRWQSRLAMLLFTTALHCVLHAAFYFRWIKSFGLDEGGYLGFVGWSIEALTGALASDVIAWAQAADSEAEGKARGEGAGELDAPLLLAAGLPTVAKSLNSAESSTPAWRERPALRRAACFLVLGGAALMLAGYLLSCLGAHPSRLLNPVCYDGTRIYFWGGFGDEADCSAVLTVDGGILVLPPFVVPPQDTNIVTMWTMTQRAGSATYHLFTAGVTACLLAAFVYLCDIGLPAPAWWRRGAGSLVLGLHTLPVAAGLEASGRVLLRWHVLDVFGENALAVYVMGDQIGTAVQNLIPNDAPAWYFVLWGEGLYVGITYVCTLYLQTHKLFLRL